MNGIAKEHFPMRKVALPHHFYPSKARIRQAYEDILLYKTIDAKKVFVDVVSENHVTLFPPTQLNLNELTSLTHRWMYSRLNSRRGT